MDILSLTAVELAKAIREGRTTAVEATQAVLDRIAAGEDTYHCYVTVEREMACEDICILWSMCRFIWYRNIYTG